MKRQKTREVRIGSVVIGGGSPVAIQSMLCAPPEDIEANVRQTRALYEAGCQINRVAMPREGGDPADPGHQGSLPHAPGGGHPV